MRKTRQKRRRQQNSGLNRYYDVEIDEEVVETVKDEAAFDPESELPPEAEAVSLFEAEAVCSFFPFTEPSAGSAWLGALSLSE